MGTYEFVEKALLWRLDRVIAVSESVKVRTGLFVRRGKVVVVPNGISDSRGVRSGAPPDIARFISGHPSILAAGRLSPEKGFDVLLRAMIDVATDFPEARLVIVGDGPERAALARQIAHDGLSDRVLLPGYVESVRDMMRHFDVLALSSYTEGLPLVILEAMSERLPVVASDVGDVGRVLEEGRCGKLLPPGDPLALSAALLALLGSAQVRSELADRARRRYEEHCSARAMADRYESEYHRVAERAASPSVDLRGTSI